ncbi:MAG TPA: response regulator transcription factor [Pyrinomonadaceae bacterium]
MEKLKILLADDHNLICAGLAALIDRESDMEVVGQARNGNEALQKAHELHPDLIIMDINMPELGGIEAAALINEKCPEVRVLALSVHEDKYHLRKVLREGAAGYLPKRAAVSELIQAIRTVASGGIYIHPSLAKGLVSLLSDNATQAHGNGRNGIQKELSEREKDVLRLLALGYSNKEIAARLKVGIKSVDTYKTRFMEKLGLKNRVEIVQYAKRQGLMDDN